MFPFFKSVISYFADINSRKSGLPLSIQCHGFPVPLTQPEIVFMHKENTRKHRNRTKFQNPKGDFKPEITKTQSQNNKKRQGFHLHH